MVTRVFVPATVAVTTEHALVTNLLEVDLILNRNTQNSVKNIAETVNAVNSK